MLEFAGRFYRQPGRQADAIRDEFGLAHVIGDDDEATDIDSILPTTSAPAATTGNAAPTG